MEKTAMVLESMTEGQGRRWASQRLVLAGLWLMLLMLVIKVLVGWATQSLSLMAAGLQTLVACFSLLLNFIAASAPQVQGREMWGHRRLESGLVIFFAGVVGFVCCAWLGLAIARVDHLLTATDRPLFLLNPPLVQLLAAVLVSGIGVAMFGRYQARLLNNPAMGFSANQVLIDSALMAIALMAVAGVSLGFAWMDPLVGGLLLIGAIASGWHGLNQQLPSLIHQVAISPEALTKSIRQVEGILHCYDIQSRGMVGRMVWVEMRLILHPECLSVAPSILGKVERIIHQQYGPAKVVLRVDERGDGGRQKGDG